MNGESLESLLALAFMETASTYEDLTDTDLRMYLENESQVSKTALSQDSFDKIIKSELHTDIRDKNAVSPMRNMFLSYHGILRRHGTSCLTDRTPNVAMNHVI